ncbi:MAG: OmpA family protein [Pricia sp.]
MLSISIFENSIRLVGSSNVPTVQVGIFVFIFFFSTVISSQNLVLNPSFEEFEACPARLGNFAADVRFWSVPTEGSTDYFNACSTAMGTPINFNGEQSADFGQGYAGLYLYAPDDYREYLQAELLETLESGKEYRISFYISLAERSDFAVREFGVLFAKDKLEIHIKKELSKGHWYRQKGNAYNYMEIRYTQFYSDTEDWVEISTRFTAKGTERFLILGNFENNARTRKFETKPDAKQGAYYYVDRVKVLPTEGIDHTEAKITIESDSNTVTNSEKKNFTLDTIHTFQNVFFEFDRSTIPTTGRPELQRIFDYLKAHPEYHITIKGHTDSMGTAVYNRQLSTERAKAVANQLMDMGISKSRITWKGEGDNIPMTTNNTDEGRRKNRRVEFVISNPNTP